MGENVLEQSIEKPSGPSLSSETSRASLGREVRGVGARGEVAVGEGERAAVSETTLGEKKARNDKKSKCRLDKSRRPLLYVRRLLHKRQARGGRTDRDHICKLNSLPDGLISSCAVRVSCLPG